MSILHALDLFLISCRLRMLSEKTLDCYYQFVQYFIKADLVKTVDELNYDVIQDYILLLLEKNLSQASIATYLRNLKVFIKWLEKEKYIKEPFTEKIKIPRTPKKIVRIYDDLEVEMIFSTINNYPLWVRYRNCAIVALMLDSGLRQEEICKLKYDDIRFRESIIKIHGKGNKERLVPFGNFTNYYLGKYIKLCPIKFDSLFMTMKGNNISRNAIKLLITKLSNKLPFQFSSHKLRHNFATNYCIDQYEQYNYIDIYKLMVLLGHEDITTTRRYLHIANQIIASKSNISHIDKILDEKQRRI